MDCAPNYMSMGHSFHYGNARIAKLPLLCKVRESRWMTLQNGVDHPRSDGRSRTRRTLPVAIPVLTKLSSRLSPHSYRVTLEIALDNTPNYAVGLAALLVKD